MEFILEPHQDHFAGVSFRVFYWSKRDEKCAEAQPGQYAIAICVRAVIGRNNKHGWFVEDHPHPARDVLQQPFIQPIVWTTQQKAGIRFGDPKFASEDFASAAERNFEKATIIFG